MSKSLISTKTRLARGSYAVFITYWKLILKLKQPRAQTTYDLVAQGVGVLHAQTSARSKLKKQKKSFSGIWSFLL
jgi:hypothetical protein